MAMAAAMTVPLASSSLPSNQGLVMAKPVNFPKPATKWCFLTGIQMGGGPRTYPGGVTKWQWKRLQEKKHMQMLKARLQRERQIYEMRKRAELAAATASEKSQFLRKPWEKPSSSPEPERQSLPLFSSTADEQVRSLADRFRKAGAVDLWNDSDGPQGPPPSIPAAPIFTSREEFQRLKKSIEKSEKSAQIAERRKSRKALKKDRFARMLDKMNSGKTNVNVSVNGGGQKDGSFAAVSRKTKDDHHLRSLDAGISVHRNEGADSSESFGEIDGHSRAEDVFQVSNHRKGISNNAASNDSDDSFSMADYKSISASGVRYTVSNTLQTAEFSEIHGSSSADSNLFLRFKKKVNESKKAHHENNQRSIPDRCSSLGYQKSNDEQDSDLDKKHERMYFSSAIVSQKSNSDSISENFFKDVDVTGNVEDDKHSTGSHEDVSKSSLVHQGIRTFAGFDLGDVPRGPTSQDSRLQDESESSGVSCETNVP